jgi:hypothetical protein
LNKEAIDFEKIKKAHLLIIAAPKDRFTPTEVEDLKKYVENGGNLLVFSHEGGDRKYSIADAGIIPTYPRSPRSLGSSSTPIASSGPPSINTFTPRKPTSTTASSTKKSPESPMATPRSPRAEETTASCSEAGRTMRRSTRRSRNGQELTSFTPTEPV